MGICKDVELIFSLLVTYYSRFRSIRSGLLSHDHCTVRPDSAQQHPAVSSSAHSQLSDPDALFSLLGRSYDTRLYGSHTDYR